MCRQPARRFARQIRQSLGLSAGTSPLECEESPASRNSRRRRGWDGESDRTRLQRFCNWRKGTGTSSGDFEGIGRAAIGVGVKLKDLRLSLGPKDEDDKKKKGSGNEIMDGIENIANQRTPNFVRSSSPKPLTALTSSASLARLGF